MKKALQATLRKYLQRLVTQPHVRGIESMASVPQSHRRAYGAHRPMSPTVKAANVARSIAQRRIENRAWTWAEYGLEANQAQQALVLAALGEVRA